MFHVMTFLVPVLCYLHLGLDGRIMTLIVHLNAVCILDLKFHKVVEGVFYTHAVLHVQIEEFTTCKRTERNVIVRLQPLY